MRRLAVLFVLLLTSLPLFAQDRGRDDDWRNRPADRDGYRRHSRRAADNAFEITPFAGYRWGGTIFAGETRLFHVDADVAPSGAFGVDLAIPVNDNGLKIELMADHQASHLERESGLFDPGTNLADVDVTYFQAGVQIPFAQSRNARPFVVLGAGIANIDPQVTGVSSESRFAASAGVGVKLPITDNVGFKILGRGFYTALENDDADCVICDYVYDRNFYQGEVNVGVTFSF
ncbi:MAG TPA: outer membrane beta-barrel protein [Thermoanaerobaculia bacterium]|nr:outer membrane beta-barrel protein [Thermoanaerobaculia bacterium]